MIHTEQRSRNNQVNGWLLLGGLLVILSFDARCFGQTLNDSLLINQTLQRYNGYVVKMDHDSIAMLFSKDGEMVGTGNKPVVGPEAIRSFLRSFSSYHVIRNGMNADSLVISRDSATQTGTYAQQVQIPSGDTVDVHGRFEIHWIRGPAGGWSIRRMATRP